MNRPYRFNFEIENPTSLEISSKIYTDSWMESVNSRMEFQRKEIFNLMNAMKLYTLMTNNSFIIEIFKERTEILQICKMHRYGFNAVLDSIGFKNPMKECLLDRLNFEHTNLIESIKNIYKYSTHENLLNDEIEIINNIFGYGNNQCACFSCFRNQNIFESTESSTSETHSIYEPLQEIPPLFSSQNHHLQADDIEAEISNNEDTLDIIDDSDEDELTDLEDIVVTICAEIYSEKIKLIKNNDEIENKNCSICLQTFDSTDNESFKSMIVKTECGHYFHDLCLRTQLCDIGPPKCPNCRHDIRDDFNKNENENENKIESTFDIV